MDRESIDPFFFPKEASSIPEWRVEENLVPYNVALNYMEERAKAIRKENAREFIWLVEHPPLYTAGTSAKEADLLEANKLPVFQTGRGGQYTYHGPGQRIIYVLLDLKKRRTDIRAFICCLEQWIINTLMEFGLKAVRREDRVGVWIPHIKKNNFPLTDACQEKKIAAIGIRIRNFVSTHGIALNISPDLNHYKGIVPCGLTNYGVQAYKI